MSYPNAIVDTMNETIECPNHNGSFDCNSFCNLCEGNQETNLLDILCQADSIAWDDCHKIYILMDDYQTKQMIEFGYSTIVSDTPAAMEKLVWQWYQDSCSLRLIDAVFTNEDKTDKFVTIVGQFFGEDEDVTD